MDFGIQSELAMTAAASTYGGMELAKRYFPGLFPEGSSTNRALGLPLLAVIAGKALGWAALAGIGWAPLIFNTVLGSVGAGLFHDKTKTVIDPILEKLPGQVKETK